jgi:hypothetical protein
MMKKVTVFILFSLLAFSGFVVGPWGPDLAGAGGGGTCVQEGTNQLTPEAFGPNVSMVIVVYKGNQIELFPPAGTTLRKPGGGAPGPIPSPELKDGGDLPTILKDEIKTAKFKLTEIKIIGENTCGNFGGTWVCW